MGYCIGVTSPPEGGRQLKAVETVLDREPLLSQKMLELTRWIAERYLCSWGQVLDSVIPSGVRRRAGTRLVKLYEAAPGATERSAESRLPEKQRAPP